MTLPRLNYPQKTKADAINFLIQLYMKNPTFVKEWEEIRKPYTEIIRKYTIDLVHFWLTADIKPEDYYNKLTDYLQTGAEEPYPAEKLPNSTGLEPYFEALSEMADKWKMRAPWAAFMLLMYDCSEVLKSTGMPEDISIPLEQYEHLYPWTDPVNPLEIKVPAWAVIIHGRKAIEGEIAKKLEAYENEIKLSGFKEYPSSLAQHAQWWYEHYVNHKKYKEIEKMFPIALEETIKRAVWDFTKLVGIKLK